MRFHGSRRDGVRAVEEGSVDLGGVLRRLGVLRSGHVSLVK
eukprot:SAG31_NODE_17830_length_656_cov_1.220826_1_plen_40_part_10